MQNFEEKSFDCNNKQLLSENVTAHEAALEADDFTVYEVKNSVFTETKLDEFAELIGQLKQKKAAQLMSDTEFLETTRTEAEQVIRSFLKAADSTGEYTVVFR